MDIESLTLKLFHRRWFCSLVAEIKLGATRMMTSFVMKRMSPWMSKVTKRKI